MKILLSKIKAFNLGKHGIWSVLILASLLRFTGLVKRDLWYDEAFTGVAVKEEFADMIAMIINDVHPPLYYIALKVFAAPFSYSVFSLRLFSAILGVAAVWATYLLAKEMLGRKAALLAALIASISPFAVQYSQEARMYAMLAFFILLAALFFLKGMRTGKSKFYMLWGLFTGLSMLVHYMGIIFAATYAVVFLVWKWLEGDKMPRRASFEAWAAWSRKFLPAKGLFLGYGAALAVFLPWLGEFIHHLNIKGGNLSWVKPAALGDVIVNVQMFLFGTPLGEMSSGMPQPNELQGIAHLSIRMILAVLLATVVAHLWKKEKKEYVLSLLVWSAGFMLVIYLLSVLTADQEYFVVRYLLPASYFLFILLGAWLARISWRFAAPLLAAYLYLISLIVPLQNSQGYNEMILNLDKYESNDFYILNSFDYVISKYYLGAERLTLYNYDWPEYDPSYWAAMGKDLKRTENFEDLRKNPRALIISNKPLKDNQYFSTEGLVLADQYKNILVYKFKDSEFGK